MLFYFFLNISLNKKTYPQRNSRTYFVNIKNKILVKYGFTQSTNTKFPTDLSVRHRSIAFLGKIVFTHCCSSPLQVTYY